MHITITTNLAYFLGFSEKKNKVKKKTLALLNNLDFKVWSKLQNEVNKDTSKRGNVGYFRHLALPNLAFFSPNQPKQPPLSYRSLFNRPFLFSPKYNLVLICKTKYRKPTC